MSDNDYHRKYMSQVRNGRYRNNKSGTATRNVTAVYNALIDFTLENNRTPRKYELDALVEHLPRQYVYNVLYKLRDDKLVDWEPNDLNTITIKGIVYVDMR